MHRTLPDHVHCMDRKVQVDVTSVIHLFDRFTAGVRMESPNHRIILGLLTLSSTSCIHMHVFPNHKKASSHFFNEKCGVVLPPPQIYISC